MAENKLVTEFLFKGSLEQLKKYNLQMLSAVKLIQKFAGVQDEGVNALEEQIRSTEDAAEVQSEMNQQVAVLRCKKTYLIKWKQVQRVPQY